MSTTTDTHEDSALTRSASGLELRNVTLEAGDGGEKIRALDDVSLNVALGEFVAVIGPSGAGKSSHPAVTPTATV